MPGSRPAGSESGGQEDPRTLFVVADADPVLECGQQANMGELAVQERRIHVDRDCRYVGRGRRPPEPETVSAAIYLGQAQAGSVPVDRSGLTVVASDDRGRPP